MINDEKKIEYLLQYISILTRQNSDYKCASEISAAIVKLEELLEIKRITPVTNTVNISLNGKVDNVSDAMNQVMKKLHDKGIKVNVSK
jgi:hypothetical protein